MSVTDADKKLSYKVESGNTAAELLDDLKARGYQVWVDGATLMLGPKDEITPVIWEAVRANARTLKRLVGGGVTDAKKASESGFKNRNARAELVKTRNGRRIDRTLLEAAREECALQRERARGDLDEGADFVAYLMALGAHAVPEEAEARRLAEEARKTAEVCGQCGRAISASDMVHIGREVYVGMAVLVEKPRYERTSLCEGCVPERKAYDEYTIGGKTVRVPDGERRAATTCAVCERPVGFVRSGHDARRPFVPSSNGWSRPAVFCCERCRWTFYNGQRKERAKRWREKTCEVCGEEFPATRVHAKTCSPACKQKAYRQRKKAGAA